MEIKQIKKKIIFTDLDETLLKQNKYYCKVLNNYIIKLLKNEYVLIPTTSKTFLEVINILKKIKLNMPFSVENGAAYYVPIRNSKNFLYKKILNPYAVKINDIRKILNKDIFEKYLHNFEFIENLSSLKQKKITKLNYDQLADFNSREYSIPILWQVDDKHKSKFMTTLLKYNLKITFGGRLNNISGIHSKLDSMKFFTSQYEKKFRTKKLTTISLGDSQNDIEILNNSNYSGIVKNNSYRVANLKKKNNIFRSFTNAPHGWVEVLKKIIIKMEKDNN